MKIYVSGPMTGIEDLNRPAFDSAASAVLASGHTAVVQDLVEWSSDSLTYQINADLREMLGCDYSTRRRAKVLTREQRENPAIRARYRLLATALVVGAVQDTLTQRHCSEAWSFFRSPMGAVCFELGYLDEDYAIQNLPRPKDYVVVQSKRRGPKGKRVQASKGRSVKYFASYVEACAHTGDCVSSVGRAVRSGNKSRNGWTYRRV